MSEVTALAAVKAHSSFGTISAIAPYGSPDAASGARTLVIDDGQLYDAGVVGSVLNLVPVACAKNLSTTSDGSQFICQGTDDSILRSVDKKTATALAVTSESADAPSGVALSPDGSLLAISNVCEIDIFAVGAANADVHVRAAFALPLNVFAINGQGCSLSGLSWSGGDEWLAFNNLDGPNRALFALRIGPLLLQMETSVDTTPRLLKPSDIADFGETNSLATPTWRSVGGSWTITFLADGNTIEESDPISPQRTTLLSVPYPGVRAIAWTPDGQRLLFVQTQEPCVDCGSTSFPNSRLYSYQPPSA